MERIILVIDDEPSILRALNRLLRSQWTVLTTDDVDQALGWLTQHEVAVVLSDYRMPSCDGVEFLKKVRTVAPDCRRYLLSGQADYDAVSAAISSGACERFLCKPWQTDQLLNHLDEAWQRWLENRSHPTVTRQSAEALGQLLAAGQLSLCYRLDISAEAPQLLYCLAGADSQPLPFSEIELTPEQQRQLFSWAEQTVRTQLTLSQIPTARQPVLQPMLEQPLAGLWYGWKQINDILQSLLKDTPERKELRIL